MLKKMHRCINTLEAHSVVMNEDEPKAPQGFVQSSKLSTNLAKGSIWWVSNGPLVFVKGHDS